MKRNVPDSWLSVVLRHLDNSQKRMITALNHSKTFHQGLTKAVRTGMCLLAMAGLTAGGSVFQNLDFEAGPIYYPPVNEYYNIYSDVLPHWTVRFGNIVQPGASCNNFTLDYPVVALMSSGGALRTSYVIDGQRSVYLQSASTEIFNNAASAVNVAISQVGTVPAVSQSLWFSARNQWFDSFALPPGPFNVTLGGAVIPMIPMTVNGGDVEFAGSIGGWSGQTTELSIGVMANSAWGGATWEGWSVLDSIRFSPEAVPEPSTAALVALGGVALAWYGAKRKALRTV